MANYFRNTTFFRIFWVIRISPIPILSHQTKAWTRKSYCFTRTHATLLGGALCHAA